MFACREACKQHNERREEQTHHRGKHSPHPDIKSRMAVTPILIDLVLDDAKQGEIARHNHDGDDERDEGDHGCEDGAEEPSTKSEEESNECQAAGNGVQHHHASERFGGVFCRVVEGDVFDLGHYLGRVVADVRAGAPVVVLAGIC